MNITEQDVINRLKPLGYSYNTMADKMIVVYLLRKIPNYIYDFCNIAEIPASLKEVAIDMICGEFLFTKRKSGQLTDFEADDIVKSIKEGDTQITYAVNETTGSFDSLVDYLINGQKSQLIKYRRFAW